MRNGSTETELVGGLLVEGGAEGEGGVGVDSVVAFVDEADDALLIDDDVGAESPLIVFVFDAVDFQNAVRSEHLAVHVAEQGKVESVLLGESGVGRGAVHADAEDGGFVGGDAAGVDAGLDRAHLRSAAFGEGEDVNGEKNVFLAAVVAELDGLPIVGEKSEIRGHVADFERHAGDTMCFVHLMGEGRSSGCSD